jgi:hypothetical protein
MAGQGDGFNPLCLCDPIGLDISGVEISRQAKTTGITALDAVYHQGTVTLFHHFCHFMQMFGTTISLAVREFSVPRLSIECDVFDFDIACWKAFSFGQEINAAVHAVFHFASK